MIQRSNSYWDKRARQRMKSYHRNADKTVATISTAYDRAIEDLTQQIDRMFNTFSRNGELSPAEARQLLNMEVPNNLMEYARSIYPQLDSEEAQRWLRTRMNAPAYKARITRLEALREQIYIQSKVIADVELVKSEALYIDTINNAYYRNMYDIQKGLGIGFNFAQLPTKTIENILKSEWSGMQFSQRIWGNTDVLAKQITEVITGGFMSGSSVYQMRKQLEERAEIGKHAANRLIRTEVTYMANAAELESYEEAEIDKYQFMATLDSKTSKMCQQHDMKVYKVSEAVPGQNMPPLHPYCRSTTIAYFSASESKLLTRRARDAEGNSITVEGNMSYNEWYEKYGRAQKKVKIDPFINEKKEIQQAIKNGEYNLKHNLQHYRKHIVGTNEYNDYVERNIAKGKQKPSYLSISYEEAQSLVDKYAGSGKLKIRRNGEWDKKEVIRADKTIGVHIHQETGKETITKSFSIHYSKKDTHIVPTLTDEE